MTNYADVFNKIYDEGIWSEEVSKSGGGSDISYNLTTYIPFLRKFIIDKNIQSVVDVGCGDFLCGPYIYDNLHIKYTGYDIYKDVIDANNNNNNDKYKFIFLDIIKDWENLEPADVCIIKDVLQHWLLKDVYQFLDNIALSKKFKYILVCNCCGQERDNMDMYYIGGFRELSANYYPLKRYEAKILYTYHTKEVSLITCR
jgi:SAM-dependent methyltransferase